MTSSYHRLDHLIENGFLAPSDRETLRDVEARFAIGLTPAMAALIDKSNPADPIARQFIPDARELTITSKEVADPIGDYVHEKVPGLVHRYPDRVLVKLTPVCPVYCRFCFRREMVGPGKTDPLSEEALDLIFSYLETHREIWEVIVTGGDPLILSPRRLALFSARLARMDHIRVVRWHTRIPAVDPDRVTAELCHALASSGKSVWLALHVNHPRELTEACRASLRRLRDAGVLLVSQSVLLKGINDDLETLTELMRAFVEAGVKPYYLHQGDHAPGTSHFRVDVKIVKSLIDRLRGRLSGLAQPVYVIDLPGGAGKVPVSPLSCDPEGEGWRIRDWQGITHYYESESEPVSAA